MRVSNLLGWPNVLIYSNSCTYYIKETNPRRQSSRIKTRHTASVNDAFISQRLTLTSFESSIPIKGMKVSIILQ